MPSATGNRLILSVDGANRYYMFLLVERSLDHFACRINLLDANKRRVPKALPEICNGPDVPTPIRSASEPRTHSPFKVRP